MKAVRGATTITHDDASSVRNAVKELLLAIEERNSFKREDITAILFSNTSDIKSFYPAKAAREAGFENSALFSSVEPEIEGALKLCIRVMLLVETDEKPVHVYLNGAAMLRKDISSVMNIALDGPAGSGKSTIAKELAREYDILYLDTGAMYRACALKVLKEGIDPKDKNKVEEIIKGVNIEIGYENGTQKTMLDGKDVSEEIRSPKVTENSSLVASYGLVREKMVDMQRKIAHSRSCVIDGRDIGSHVIKNTPFKFYVTALSEVRAMRRYKELKEKGFDVNFDKIHEDIKERDHNDMTREFSPLVKADDAIEVDTSDMSISEAVDFIKKKIQEKI